MEQSVDVFCYFGLYLDIVWELGDQAVRSDGGGRSWVLEREENPIEISRLDDSVHTKLTPTRRIHGAHIAHS